MASLFFTTNNGGRTRARVKTPAPGDFVRRPDGDGKMDAKPHVVFYTKPGCHLCEDALREIARAACAGQFTFEEVNILDDPELRRRYATEIPVVLINGTHAFKFRLTATDFRRAIQRRKDEG